MTFSYYSLSIGLFLYFTLHSILASSHVKKVFNDLWPAGKPYYRVFFNLFALIFLLPIIYIYFNLASEPLFISFTALQILGVLLSITGLYVLVNSFKNYRTDEFIGTYQLKNKHDFHPTYLNRSGWNNIVRHPLYFGTILLVSGVFIFDPTIKLSLISLIIILYIYIGTIWEEKKLMVEFDEYKQYKEEVSMLIPIKWVINRLSKK